MGIDLKNTKFVNLKGYRNVSCESFRVRTTCGQDTIDAAVRCMPLNDQPIDNNLFGIQMRQQMLATAIIEVDGKPVTGDSYQPSIQWNARTREYLAETYDYVNGLSQKERDDFRAALAAGDDPSASGSTTSSVG